MKQPLKILLLEDSLTDAEMIQRLLLKDEIKYEFRLATNKKNFVEALEEFIPEIILSDNSLPQFNATEALKITRQQYPQVPFILVTGTVSEEYATAIIKGGADDYILKDRMTRLPAAIHTALKQRKDKKEIADYKYALDESSDVTITDQKGIIIYANKNFCNISKYPVYELIGQDHRITSSGYHPPSFIKNLWVTIANGKIWHGEFRNKAKDGSLYWEDTTVVPFLDEKGKPYQYLAIRKDITKRKIAEQDLQTAHDRLSFHIENAPLGFIEWDNHLRVKHWSKRAEEIFGWTETESIARQKDGFSQVYEEDLPMVRKTAEQLLTGKVERNSVQNRNYTKDGRVIWCEWFNSVLKDKEGKVITILSLVQDITERKKAEQDLLQSQMRLKQAQEIAHLGSWEINFKTNKAKWSDEAYRIYGITPGDHNLSIEDWMSFVHPEDLVQVKQKIDDSFITLNDISFHHCIIRKDGVVRHLISESKFEFDKEGKPIGLFGIAHDITENWEAEEELRKSNERFQYATKATSDIIWELNFETKQYLLHEGREKIFEKDTVVDWKLGVEGKYIVGDDREKVRQSFSEARKDMNRTLWEMEYRLYAKNNTIQHIVNHAIFIRNRKGKAIRVIGAMSDVTDKKNLEAELREQQRKEQLKMIATALEAQEKERNAIGQELHDNVNQILVATKMLLSLTRATPDKTEEMVTSSINNIQEAIDENRKIAHILVTPDLKTEVFTQQLLSLTSKMLETVNIVVRIDATHFQEELLSDEQKLATYRIAQEQCTNIVKHSKATGVNISLSTGSGFFEMIIADDGIGMEAGKKPKGIGLKNIKGRLSVFNGTATIDTAPAKGFALGIKIPLAE